MIVDEKIIVCTSFFDTYWNQGNIFDEEDQLESIYQNKYDRKVKPLSD